MTTPLIPALRRQKQVDLYELQARKTEAGRLVLAGGQPGLYHDYRVTQDFIASEIREERVKKEMKTP